MSYGINHQVGVKASPEEIYKALTETGKLAQWWTTDTIGSDKKSGTFLILVLWLMPKIHRCFFVLQAPSMKSMTKKTISPGAVHSVPADLRKVLISDAAARAKWEDITPLARNEWICWVISVKKPETRRQHIERVRTELREGMRRPCCWPGCPHR